MRDGPDQHFVTMHQAGWREPRTSTALLPFEDGRP
jgi:hypothetical protein